MADVDCLIRSSYIRFLQPSTQVSSTHHPQCLHRHHHVCLVTCTTSLSTSLSIKMILGPPATQQRHSLRKKVACEGCKLIEKRCSQHRPTYARCREHGRECRYRGDINLTAEDESSTTESRLGTPAPGSIFTSPTPCPSTASTLPLNSDLFNLVLSSIYQTASQNASPESVTTQGTLHFDKSVIAADT